MSKELTRGQKISQTNRERYGEDYYSKLGKKGGGTPGSGQKAKATMFEKYGSDYYKNIRAKRRK